MTFFGGYLNLNYNFLKNTCFILDTTTTITTTAYFEQTTTTTPQPGCIVGNLDNRVCILEDQFEEFDENFQAENSRLNSVTEGLRSEIQVLRREKLELQQNMAAAVEDLQTQITELANKPCACR